MNLVVLAVFRDRFDQQLLAFHLPPEIEQALIDQQAKLAGAEVPPGLSDRVRMALEAAIDQSFIDEFRLIMVIAVLLSFTSSLVAIVMIQPGKKCYLMHIVNSFYGFLDDS